ncbi:hypothetical protein DEO72_LG3g2276 [Vigna unguiculata]|uniref:Uncharacterized protein n=1 Tax=Vigna unguiculata TaxID=3917 RepID=A0A4D6LH81_VIGUN|nr:hypothetical protein DEO72_LG3g2276 [Vigna unguiculata]
MSGEVCKGSRPAAKETWNWSKLLKQPAASSKQLHCTSLLDEDALTWRTGYLKKLDMHLHWLEQFAHKSNL